MNSTAIVSPEMRASIPRASDARFMIDGRPVALYAWEISEEVRGEAGGVLHAVVERGTADRVDLSAMTVDHAFTLTCLPFGEGGATLGPWRCVCTRVVRSGECGHGSHKVAVHFAPKA